MTVGVNNGVAAPLPDIGRLDHVGLPLRSIAQPLAAANPEQCRIQAAYPELWRRFTITVRRALARRAGLTNNAFAAQVRLSYARVAEYQPRGVVHFHAIIRPWPWKLWELAARGVDPHERGLSRMVSRHHSPRVIRRIKMCAIVALVAVFLPSGSPRPTGSGAGLWRSLADREAGPGRCDGADRDITERLESDHGQGRCASTGGAGRH
ncbi:MAG: replication initiator [Isosphaeraceae bacterium]